ncbi:MAG: 16S rRNA (cytidine(1402)-2'-O)-methyltransferase [Acidimicrobiia bacterium]|nr:16S rRNA (cytidine(1402)-2'-O)-methyltransferase [Acidimicrobiia bacterium]
MSGALVLVATPIGNLGDLSARAGAELARADAIACEDTRRTGALLAHLGIRGTPLLTVNDHTEAGQISPVMDRLRRGERVVLVSDAGTPAISDPGARLVRAAARGGFEVLDVPGPCAAISALVRSGLPTARFCFEGFLPRKPGARAQRLEALAGEARTMVFYEAPHRAVRTLEDLASAFGPQRGVAVARELTKLYEEVWRSSLADALTWARERPPRGEFVLVVEGAPPDGPPDEATVAAALDQALAGGGSVKDAATEVARELGIPRREAYELAVARRAGRTG